MRKRIVGMIGLTVFCFAQITLAAEFSAEIVSKAKEGTFTGKIFAVNDKVRMEIPGTVTITRTDKNVVWVLMPQQNMYMEQAFDPRNVAQVAEEVPGEIERKFIGDEAVDGKSTKKYHVIYEAMGEKAEIFQWIDPKTNIPLKTATIDNSWSMEYRNLKMRPQDSGLFEVPRGYTKFSMPNMTDIARAMQGADTE